MEIAEYSRVMGIYQWDYSACTVAFTVAVEEKRCTPVCGAVKRNAGGMSKPWELGTSLLFNQSGYERIGSEDGTPDDRIVVSSY